MISCSLMFSFSCDLTCYSMLLFLLVESVVYLNVCERTPREIATWSIRLSDFHKVERVPPAGQRKSRTANQLQWLPLLPQCFICLYYCHLSVRPNTGTQNNLHLKWWYYSPSSGTAELRWKFTWQGGMLKARVRRSTLCHWSMRGSTSTIPGPLGGHTRPRRKTTILW